MVLDLVHSEKLFIPVAKWQILDFSKLKGFADDNFEFDENSSKVEKTLKEKEVTGAYVNRRAAADINEIMLKAA